MAFQEPASLKWTEGLPLDDFPDLSREDYAKTLQLVKIWDAKNLSVSSLMRMVFHGMKLGVLGSSTAISHWMLTA
jgi:hypothetical protein